MLQLNSSQVFIGNPYGLEKKLQEISLSNMRVVSDFDGTMTSAISHTSWDLINQLPQLGEEYSKLQKSYYKDYHPYEVDPYLTKDARDMWMSEWWKKHTNLFGQFLFQQEYLGGINAT